ncbi:phospholipid:diacylglycerol acyltransferase 2 [Olea europaea subsp. europaea]|uniref:Phospholipid:diacylglycerol acyltransferase 2 n=1 Tax=Olea europaea subsp. europaea TaxID=158383 RepID=A0A8S0PEK0_OLEEU|nr:phospholipid:diacylglycerol acyltransferase 2 [Olea europaea subsp. europaea]
MAPRLLDFDFLGLQTLEHVMRVSRTWDSIISLITRGETIWGNLDWPPEEGHVCDSTMKKYNNGKNGNNSGGGTSFRVQELTKYGRISFGKASFDLPSSQLPVIGSEKQDFVCGDSSPNSYSSCGDVRTEYNEMSQESIQKIAENKAYTMRTLLDLHCFIAPKMMKQAESQLHGIADNLDDPKYNHYKYWSNPLETKLSDAPDMEIYCLYWSEFLLKYLMCTNYRLLVDRDESVPILSAGFTCTKGWKGKTRFNPTGIATYIREYEHKPLASLLEGRGLESAAHVDIMRNVVLIEDILRVTTGAFGAELGVTEFIPISRKCAKK